MSPGRCKAGPLQDWANSYGSRRLGLPEFLDNQHMKVTSLSESDGHVTVHRDNFLQ